MLTDGYTSFFLMKSGLLSIRVKTGIPYWMCDLRHMFNLLHSTFLACNKWSYASNNKMARKNKGSYIGPDVLQVSMLLEGTPAAQVVTHFGQGWERDKRVSMEKSILCCLHSKQTIKPSFNTSKYSTRCSCVIRGSYILSSFLALLIWHELT